MRPLTLLIFLLMASFAGSAQSPAERLEKGIYEQDTAGNLKSAVAIFERIIGDVGSDSATAAEAAYRLGQCELQRGDADAAKKAFNWLIENHPQQSVQLQKILSHLNTPAPLGSSRLQAPPAAKPRSAIQQKLSQLIFPRVSFENAEIATVIAYLTQRAQELDPDGTGVNILLQVPEKATLPKVTIDFDNIPMSELIRYVCVTTGLKYRVEEHAVLIADELPLEDLETRFYPLNDFSFVQSHEPFEEDAPDPVAYFEALGVSFPEGTRIRFAANVNRLIVTNTAANLARIEEILRQVTVAPTQIRVSADLVVVSDPRLAKINPADFSYSLLTEIPEEKRRSYPQTSLVTLSGSTCAAVTQGAGMTSKFEVTPLLDSDGFTIHLEIKWQCDFSAPNAAEIDNFDIQTAILLWDGETVAFMLPAAVDEAKNNIGVLLLTAVLINPAGEPLRGK